MCECHESYLIRSVGSNPAYTCPICNKIMADVPDIKDGIMEIWKKPFSIPMINHENIAKNSFIDYNSERFSNNNSMVIDKQVKVILKDFYMNGYSNKRSVDYNIINLNGNNIQSYIVPN